MSCPINKATPINFLILFLKEKHMQNNANVTNEANQDDVFLITVIEENDISQDALCNSLGCA